MASENPFQSPAPGDTWEGDAPPNSHWAVRHVRFVSVLLIVQGFLTLAMAGMLIFFAVVVPNATRQAAAQGEFPAEGAEEMTQMMNMVSIGYGIAGGIIVLIAILEIVAGFRNWSFRSRTIGIAAMIGSLLTMFTCYCAPTAIAVSVYGLIVMLQNDVARAFEMRKQGASVDDILETFV